MTMSEVLAAAHDPIYLDDLGKKTQTTTAMWVVREKQGEANYVPIGSIIFKDGRVVRLERDLKGFSTADAKDVGNVLFQAVERLKNDDPSAGVNTRSTFISSENGQIRKITIGTGLRRIEILIPDNGEMTICEVLTLGKLPVDSK